MKYKQIRTLLPLLTLTVWGAGCSSSKQLTEMGHKMEQTLPASYADREDTLSWASLKWQEFFGDEVLVGYIDQALNRNFELLQAVKNSELAAAQLWQVKADWLPEFAAQGTVQMETDRENVANVNGQFAWELDIWGKAYNRRQEAQAQWKLTQEEIRGVRAGVAVQVASTYHMYHVLDSKEKLLQRQLALTDSIIRFQRFRYRQGSDFTLEYKQSEAHRDLLRGQMENLKKDKNSLLHTFAQLTGSTEVASSLACPQEITAPQGFIDWGIQTGIPGDLLRNRADLRGAEQTLIVCDARLGLARKNFYPSFQINGSAGSSSILKNLFTGDTFFGILEGGLVQPLFQKRKLRGALKQAKIQLEAAELKYRQVFTEAFLEVSGSLKNFQHLQEQLHHAENRYERMEEVIYDSRLLYEKGKLTYSSLLLAQQNHLDALMQYEDTRSAYLLAIIELYRALGGGCE